jgi:hypothetical protein
MKNLKLIILVLVSILILVGGVMYINKNMNTGDSLAVEIKNNLEDSGFKFIEVKVLEEISSDSVRVGLTSFSKVEEPGCYSIGVVQRVNGKWIPGAGF